METKQVRLVQESFAQVVPIAEMAATMFYDRLFEIAPDVRPLFVGDMEKQKLMLMQTLSAIVIGLGQPEKILPAAKSLAINHKGYGVRPEHFQSVGAALLWTLEKGLGHAYTPEVNEAWVAAYTFLSDVMIETMITD